MQDSFDLTTIIFLALAVFVIWKLRSVLGTRTGHERTPSEALRGAEPQAPGPAPETNVVRMPGRVVEDPAATPEVPDPERWKGFAEPGSPLAAGLDAIVEADRSFNARDFREGAKAAYEMIVTAFAQGDKRMLKDLLSKEVYDGFVGAISERERRGERIETTFVSIDKADLSEAQVRNRNAQVTMHFVSKLITATYDKDGAVVDGAADKVVDVTDVWTFSRDLGSRDPNWKLIATEAGH
jgi:predicted lipid-binding transport protein (Tim44 family)